MRGEDAAGDGLPMSSHGKRTVQASRWTQHWREDDRGHRANSAGGNEAWLLLEGGEGRTTAGSYRTASLAASHHSIECVSQEWRSLLVMRRVKRLTA